MTTQKNVSPAEVRSKDTLSLTFKILSSPKLDPKTYKPGLLHKPKECGKEHIVVPNIDCSFESEVTIENRVQETGSQME